MAQNNEPFTPMTAGTVSRTVTNSTANVALAKTGNPQTVMIVSISTGNIAFIEFGDSTVTASASTGTPVLPGSIVVFTIGASVTHIAAIGSATTTLYITCGHGA